MFGFLKDCVDGVASAIDDTLEDVTKIRIASAMVSPVSNGLDVLDGLTELEIRERAVLRFGIDIASMYATSELLEMLRKE